jgi:NTE family protein
MSEEKYNIGLVLSGGGARGFAHLGVIQALNESGIFPDIVTGTSAGALAGSLYCDGYTPKEIMKFMKTDSRLSYMRPTLPRDGLLQISGIIKILETHLRAKTFEDLKIPLIVAATDLNNGKAVYFSRGELLNRVIASASIPVLFKPVIMNNIHYVDGGIMDNLPIAPIENICRLKIGSFVNPIGFENITGSLLKIAVRTFLLSMSKEIAEKFRKFNLLIAPEELKNFSILDPEKAEDVYNVGYRATKEKLKNHEVQKLFSIKIPEK